MDKETTDKLYALVRTLKEKKPFLTLSNTKANHWIEVLNIILDNKLEKTLSRLDKEGQEKRFKTIVEVLTMEEFDKKLNENIIKPLHIIGTRLLKDKNIEVAYTTLLKREVEEEKK